MLMFDTAECWCLSRMCQGWGLTMLMFDNVDVGKCWCLTALSVTMLVFVNTDVWQCWCLPKRSGTMRVFVNDDVWQCWCWPKQRFDVRMFDKQGFTTLMNKPDEIWNPYQMAVQTVVKEDPLRSMSAMTWEFISRLMLDNAEAEV